MAIMQTHDHGIAKYIMRWLAIPNLNIITVE